MVLNKVRAYHETFACTRYRRVPDLLRLLGKRPAILAAVNKTSGNCSGAFETST